MLKLFWLPEHSKDKNQGSFPTSFPGLGALKVPGQSFVRKLPALWCNILQMLNLCYCHFIVVLFFCIIFSLSAVQPTTKLSFRSTTVCFIGENLSCARDWYEPKITAWLNCDRK